MNAPVRFFAALLLILAGLGVSPAHASTPPGPSIELRTLSNRADLISGGDALMEVALPAPATGLKVLVDGSRDVTSAFRQLDPQHYRGMVDGLAMGANVVTARLTDGQEARLTVVNHASQGPVFSGPQIQPWYCLPGALDAQCSRPAVYTYQYKSSVTGKFAAYDPSSPPSDVATTTTDQGKTVPYVVRIENGNLDRAQYGIAVLYDGSAPFDRWTGPPAWNHKVYEWYGAGCSTSHVEAPTPDVMQDNALAKGFAVMSTALSDNDYNCNIAVQAESIMMAKEHLIETYGDVRYLFGYGCSGGSIASLQIANAYPGLIDGVMVYCTMPDVPTLDLLDCTALLRYFEDPRVWKPGVVWPDNQQANVTGMQSTSVCHAWVEAYHYPEVFNPKTGVGCQVTTNEPAKMYDPVTNPGGLRCSLQDYMANVFPERPKSQWSDAEKAIGHGFAGRPYDNVGLMYGLRALQAGQISAAQFADLNAKVGAPSIDWTNQPTRVESDPATLAAAYRSGFVDEGNGLDQVAIIDTPGYIPGDRYEIHDNTKSWALRARLDHFNGNHDNQILWYGLEGRFQDNFGTMDAWLTNVESDHRDIPRAQKLREDKPAAAKDQCYYPDNGPVCDAAFGPAGNPRWAAGGSIAQDVIKCQLKPLVRSDFAPAVFADDDWAALQAAFPTGVCDWTKDGVSQQPTVAWQSYENGPGGVGLGEPPTSGTVADPPADVPEASYVLLLPLLAAGLLAGLRIRRPTDRQSIVATTS
ncbi:MAG: hypothetical protein JWP11_235 [Frankiales bacterium]|nr:hypothetical protein [Frankiales bacterium]